MATEILEAKVSLALWLVTSGVFLGIGHQASVTLRDAGLALWSQALADQLSTAAQLARGLGVTVPFTYSSPYPNLKPTVKLEGNNIEIHIEGRTLSFKSGAAFGKATLEPDTSYILQATGSEVQVKRISS